MVISREDAARRLAADEFLGTGYMAALAGVARNTMTLWIAAAKEKYGIEFRYTESLGGQRKYHPDDVRALIAKVTKIHGGNEEADPTPM